MTIPGDLVNAADLHDLLAQGNCRVIDCRHSLFDPDKGRADFLEGHIPGAVHAHMDVDLASEITADSGRHPLPDADEFSGKLESWGVSNDTDVVCYDYANGALAVRLWWMLRCWLGHARVSVLDGGMSAWQAAGGEIETAVVEHPRAEFVATPDMSAVATTADIAAAVASNLKMNLIDARDEGRFRGDNEPIDSIAGHVPGARNLPLGISLNEDNTWRDQDELVKLWQDFRAGGSEEPMIMMCGSGVTACHLILSARLAGLPPSKLYVGSWSEWIRDESRPIETAD